MGREAKVKKQRRSSVKTLAEGAYFRLRAALGDRAKFEGDVEAARATHDAKIQKAMTTAGLDPTKFYKLDDAALTATIVKR